MAMERGFVPTHRSQLPRLAPEVNRVLYVRNLPFKISGEDLYELFGKYGGVRQIRLGNTKETRGTAYVAYEDIYDARNAQEHLSGFNVQGRYLVVVFHSKAKYEERMDAEAKRKEIALLRAKYGIAQ